jgi:hypothetical protein
MKESTQKLIDQIDAAHDWINGQVWGGGGTRYSSTDTCQVCSMRRHYFSDSQNGVPGNYRYSDGETGADLSLRQAVARGCA